VKLKQPATERPQPAPTSLSPWLAHLHDHVPLARSGEDPEGVHQVRVAAGRLGVFVELAGFQTLRSDLRWLRSRASAARDLDVLLSEGGRTPAWLEWLQGERLVARAQLLEALESSRFEALGRALECLPVLDLARAKGSPLRRLKVRCEERTRDARRKGATLEEIHALRRALRRWRYGREWVGAKAKGAKELQEALGLLNDATVALEWFDAWPGAPGEPQARLTLERRLQATRRAALAALRASRERED
jgi:CHAD domain-containing protein